MIICLLTVYAATAQGSIRGTVKIQSTNEENQVVKEPLVLSVVYVTWGGDRIYTRTNEHGDYTFRSLEPGTYVLVITGTNIDTTVVPDIHVTGTATTFVEEVVIQQGVTLTGFTIIGRDEPLASESPSKVQIRGGDLSNFPDPRSINHVIGNLGGAYVSDDGRQISFRGARIGDALYVIDGVRQRGTNVTLPARSIGTITSYNGGIPAQYGDFLGGVVVIETMSYFDWENQQEVKRLRALQEERDELRRIEREKRMKEMEQQKPAGESPESEPSDEIENGVENKTEKDQQEQE